jgi:hypothetical protein
MSTMLHRVWFGALSDMTRAENGYQDAAPGYRQDPHRVKDYAKKFLSYRGSVCMYCLYLDNQFTATMALSELH